MQCFTDKASESNKFLKSLISISFFQLFPNLGQEKIVLRIEFVIMNFLHPIVNFLHPILHPIDSNTIWYAACYTFQTVVWLPVNILLKSVSRPIKHVRSKLSTLVQRCPSEDNGKNLHMQRN